MEAISRVKVKNMIKKAHIVRLTSDGDLYVQYEDYSSDVIRKFTKVSFTDYLDKDGGKPFVGRVSFWEDTKGALLLLPDTIEVGINSWSAASKEEGVASAFVTIGQPHQLTLQYLHKIGKPEAPWLVYYGLSVYNVPGKFSYAHEYELER